MELLEGNDLADIGEIILESWILALIRAAVEADTIVSLSGSVVYILAHPGLQGR